jgi:putative endonuclease
MTVPESWFIYILECENGSFYTGITDDLVRRFKEHRKGTIKSKYTRSFKPVRIAGSWMLAGSKAGAMKIERFIKGMDKKKKYQLVNNPDMLPPLILKSTGLNLSVVDVHPEWLC